MVGGVHGVERHFSDLLWKQYWFKTEDLAQAEQCLVLCLRLEFYNTNVSSFCEENGIAGLSVRPMAFVIIDIKGPCIPRYGG